jgi:hypothetical protein
MAAVGGAGRAGSPTQPDARRVGHDLRDPAARPSAPKPAGVLISPFSYSVPFLSVVTTRDTLSTGGDILCGSSQRCV